MQKLQQFNKTEQMFQLVESVIDPSNFADFEQCQQSIGKFARCLRADGWMINQSRRPRSSLTSFELEQIYQDYDGDFSLLSDEETEAIFEPCFELVPMSQDDNRAAHVVPDVSFLTNDRFLKEQIQKANAALQEQEYARAITLARTLAEQVQFSIFEHEGLERPEAKGDLAGLYKHTKKILNLDPSNEDLDKALKKILSGLISILDGLGPLSSDAGDRHAMTYNPQKHHAQLAVNTAFTFCDFLVASYKYQTDRKKIGRP